MTGRERAQEPDIGPARVSEPPTTPGAADAGHRRACPPIRRVLRAVLVVVAAAVVALAVGEVVFRCLPAPTDPNGFPLYALAADPITGVRYRPNLHLRVSYGEKGKRFRFTTNSLGFRSREVEWTKPPGTFRILFVGDEFTEGFGVNDDETFPHYVEEILRQIDRSVEVINAGQTGCGLPECVGLLRGSVSRLSPDLVVVEVNAARDAATSGPSGAEPRFGMAYGRRCEREVADRWRGDVGNRRILIRTPESGGAALDRRLYRYSALFRAVSDGALRLSPVRALLARLGWIEEEPGLPVEAPDARPYLRAASEATGGADYAGELERLGEIRASALGVNAQPFILVIPNRLGLPRFEALWNESFEAWRLAWEKQLGRPLRPDEVDKIQSNERWRRIVPQALMASANLTNGAIEAARYDEFYQLTYAATGGHFTPDDNLYTALVLVGAFIDRGLLPHSISIEGLKTMWRRDWSRIQPPFFAPDPPEMKGGQLALWGFGRGTIASSLATTGGAAGRYEVEGAFSTLLNVQPPCERAKKGDYVAFALPLGNRPTSDLLALATEICFPAMAERLNEAVRLSVRLGDRVIMERSFISGDQGRWEPLILGLPLRENATTLTIRVEAMRDFDRAPAGEFPLLLRMRRLRIFRFSDQKALWKALEGEGGPVHFRPRAGPLSKPP